MTDQKPSKIENLAAKLITYTDPARVYRLKKRPEAGEIEYAGFNDRVFSSIIDIVLCLFVFYKPLFFIAALIFGNERATQLYTLTGFTMTAQQQLAMVQSPGYIQAYLLNSLMQAAVLSAVFVFAWSYSAATPGKFLLRMRIVDEKTGCRPTYRQFVIRLLGAVIGSLPLMLGFLWIAFDNKKKGWHDKMAGTVVIKVKHWRITPPEISEYPAAALAAMQEDEIAEEEEEDAGGDYAVVQTPAEAPAAEEKTAKDFGKDQA